MFTNTSLFLGVHEGEGGRHEVETWVQALVPEEGQGRRPAVLALLTGLFPQIDAAADHDFVLGLVFGHEGLATLRVAHPAVFDRYFQFGVPSRVEPRSEIADLLGALPDRVQAATALRRLADTAIEPSRALSWLWQHLPNLDVNAREELLLALGDVSPALVDEAAPGVASLAQDAVTEIVTWLLRNPLGGRSRAEVLKVLVEQTADLRLQGLLLVRQESGDEPLASATDREEAFAQAVSLWLERIRRAAQNGSLARDPALSYLLLLWERWAGAEEPRQWVDNLMVTPDGMVTLVVSCITYQSSIDQEGRRQHEMLYDLNRLEQLVSLQHACASIGNLPPESLEEGWRRKALGIFQKVCQQRVRAGGWS